MNPVPTHASATAHATAFVERAYRGLPDEVECLVHVEEVGDLLVEIGCTDDLVAAGILHDVVEDTSVTLDEVRAAFGLRIAAIVGALTEDPAIADTRARKRALRGKVARADTAALIVFAADKLARVRAAEHAGAGLAPEKLEHYRRSLDLLLARGVRTPHIALLETLLQRDVVVPQAAGRR